MLVLRRRPGEKILIRIPDRPDVVVTCLDSKTAIGIDAAEDVQILREEIADNPPITTLEAFYRKRTEARAKRAQVMEDQHGCTQMGCERMLAEDPKCGGN